MTVTPAKLEANRRNARKSTGPRTQAGKDRSKRNGITHGIFCNQIVLSDESQNDFDNLRSAFLLQLRPADVMELMLVDRIVAAAWKIRRFNRVEALTLEGQAHLDAKEINEEMTEAMAERIHQKLSEKLIEELGDAEFPASPTLAIGRMLMNPASVALERLGRYMQRLESSIHRALKELREMRKRTQSQPPCRETEDLFVPQVEDEDRDESAASDGQSEPKEAVREDSQIVNEPHSTGERSAERDASDDLAIVATMGAGFDDLDRFEPTTSNSEVPTNDLRPSNPDPRSTDPSAHCALLITS